MSRSINKPRLLTAALLAAGLLTACGGGGESKGSDLVAKPSISPTAVAGTISGLGSVILNGIRYETIGASVLDADDSSVFRSPMGLGMTVSIEPSATSATVASIIHVQSGIQGETSLVESAAKTLNVAGLPVFADTTTFIVSAAGTAGSFADLPNSQVEVYGLPQTDGTFKATRIEVKAIASNVQLVGAVSNFNAANTTFNLGAGSNTVTVRYLSATAPTGLGNGSVVAVHTATTASANTYSATGVYLRSTSVATYSHYATDYLGTTGIASEVNELFGMVSALTASGSGCTLQVQGVPVSSTSATLCASLRDGDYVEVKGMLSNGALAAYRVEFKTAGTDRDLISSGYSDDSNDRDGDQLKYSRLPTSTSNSNSSYEIYGTLSNCAYSTCTLTSNGTVLSADLSTAIWDHGYSAVSGLVEAKGYMTAANTFKVTKIESKR